MSRDGYAIVVDDKIKPRIWGVEALLSCGFNKNNIVEASYGDEAYKQYKQLKNAGHSVDIILSDYHMDVRRKPPQGALSSSFKNASIFSGVELADRIFEEDHNQKFCLVSAGLDIDILKEARQSNIDLVMYKRRPETHLFQDYVSALHNYLNNEICPQESYDLLPERLKANANAKELYNLE